MYRHEEANPDRPKNMPLLKNPQFWPNYWETDGAPLYDQVSLWLGENYGYFWFVRIILCMPECLFFEFFLGLVKALPCVVTDMWNTVVF